MLATASGATIGGIIGGRFLQSVDEKILRIIVIIIGAALTIGLFIKAP